MLRSWRLAGIIGLSMLAGCTGMNFNTVQRTKQLAVGMTEAEVIAALGRQPDSRAMKDGRTVLRFTLQEPWKGYVPYDMVFDKELKLASWAADEEAYQRSQQAMAQMAKDMEGQGAQGAANQPGAAAAPAGPNDAELQRWIAGSYMSYSGSTYRQLVLSAGGNFRYNRESSYSGREGEVGGVWGAASQSGDTGTWTISGNRDSGQIHLQYRDGRRQNVAYRRGRESGVFTFDGVTFAYERAAD